MKRVAIYIRVSTVEQAKEGYSLEAQEAALQHYAAAHGYEVIKVYPDEGISAKDILHRKGMLALLEAAKRREFDLVLVWKLTRFTRSIRDLENTCALLEKHDISLVSLTESFDSASAAGRLMRRMLGVIAEFEREVVGENTKAAMDARARKGLPTCSYVLGYDVQPDTLTVNEAEAKYVQMIYQEYLRCGNYSEVMRLCHENGITGKRGCPMTVEGLRRILSRPIYIGFFSWRGERIQGNYDPIIDLQTWELAQQRQVDKSKIRRRNSLL